MKIPINNKQRKELVLCLVADKLNISIIPELAELLPNTVKWFEFWDGICKTYNEPTQPPHINLDRNGKIAILNAIKRGFINLTDFAPLIEKEEKRERFIELMTSTA